MCQTIEIAIRPHLRLFIKEHLPIDGKLPIQHTSRLGAFILNCLEVRNYPIRGRRREKNVIELKVPNRLKNGLDGRSGFYHITEIKEELINDLFEFIMEKELFDRLDLIEERGELRQRNGKQASEIRAFIEKYSSDGNDLSFDTLKKRYQRYKKRGESLLQREFQ